MSDSDTKILHLLGNVPATGQIKGALFIVCKGSSFSANETKSCPVWNRSCRKQLLTEGKVKGCVFTEDVFFNSPSAAASCLTGSSANGNTMWLYPNGQSIKDKAMKK